MNCPYTYTRQRVELFIDVHDQSIEYKIRRHGIQRLLIRLDTRHVICSVLTHLEVSNPREFPLLAGVVLVDIGKFHLPSGLRRDSQHQFGIPDSVANRISIVRAWDEIHNPRFPSVQDYFVFVLRARSKESIAQGVAIVALDGDCSSRTTNRATSRALSPDDPLLSLGTIPFPTLDRSAFEWVVAQQIQHEVSADVSDVIHSVSCKASHDASCRR